ncbi:MAG: hypothetical protein BVN34_07735 [Proteobacteria bacterium ST_bin12]|nr:MAG: hypothetical protein BVN34_07735 [Proteobacteria bacterium ST_bin12]
MTLPTKNKIQHKLLRVFSMMLLTLTMNHSYAALTDLGNAPLVSATTGDVLPNLMYILDNSGSMGFNYMPDYVNDTNKCKNPTSSSSSSSTSATAFTSGCVYGDPAYNTSEFNTIYYDPQTTYNPPKNANGIERNSMNSANTSGWTVVPNDAYGVQSNTNARLVPNAGLTDGYLDRVWCNTTGTISAAQANNPAICKRNNQYTYPNFVSDNQTQSYNQARDAYGYPYYYKVASGEYCTNRNLTSCINATAPTATHTFPAKVRWCTNVAVESTCQGKYSETTGHTRARWSGLISGSVSSIRILPETLGCGGTGQPSCISPTALRVGSITLDGVSIIPLSPSPALTITNTTSATQRATLASNIAAAINAHVSSPDFTATASGDMVILNEFTNATLVMTTASPQPTADQPGTKSTGTLTITSARTVSSVTSITVGTTEILGTSISASGGTNNATNRNALANALVTRINSFVSSPDFMAESNGANDPVITITSVKNSASTNQTLAFTENDPNNRLSITRSGMTGGSDDTTKTYTIPHTITQSANTAVVPTFQRVDVEPGLTFEKAPSRTDCPGSVCTYEEEMTNFANWYSYYRTRMQLMKSSTSLAFQSIDTRFRVGFITINNASSNYLPVAQYNATQKSNWYNRLFAANPNGGTPLRQSLSTVGRIFSGRGSSAGVSSQDPVQFSCQQNFSILTTDGYWNGNGGVEINGSTTIGNMDGGSTPRPQFEGPTASSNSLSDVAKYYYDTDLRTGTPGSAQCTGSTRPNGTTGDVCENNVFVTPTDNNLKQHMTTFTLGLGVDASLTYTSDYRTATEGDFFELKQGTRNWPLPAADSQTAVDDLWHAAVNGQGSYFSAKNPNQLSTSLTEALSSITAKVGAGAAAATSTLNPVSGDNFTYVASYTSVKWTGNLEARTINTNTGEVSEDATWCIENVIADSCAAPSSVVGVAEGNSTVYQCVTPGSTTATCSAPGVLDGTDCKVEIATSCTGTMQSFVSDTTDSRNIFMNVSGTLGAFNAANLNVAGKTGNFTNAFLSNNLSQWSTLTTEQRALANTTTLINFLRGNNGYEDRASNTDGVVDSRLYRFRESVLGDLIDSTPVFVGAPKANFADPGYGPDSTIGAFKTTQANRAGTIYIGSNDGMLHAIDATNGNERWAYVPTMVMNNLWKLADKNYGNGVSHSYYVDGDIVINDICTANCTIANNAVWRTILVAGLNGGGEGYFALDITVPNSPQLLWEFDASDDDDIGYSYGNPVITKKADGTWVVVFTTGYNNVAGTNRGEGALYVVNAVTGTIISKYDTDVGSATTPSGLSKINAFIVDAEVNNQAAFIYGGDLLGNVWRFNINLPKSTTNPFKVAVLRDSSGVVQPITARPELVEISGKRVLYVGTGKYLGTSDLTDNQQQTIYAITDEATATTALDNPRASSLMVKQTLVNNADAATRTVQQPANQVNFASGRGWYIDLPDTGERQSVPAQLVFGTLLLPTTVPSNTVCSPGGYGWLNFLDYKTGASVAGNVVASKTNAPIVGLNILYIKGKPVVNVVTADNPTPQFPPQQPTFTGGSASGFTNHRVIWRELINE